MNPEFTVNQRAAASRTATTGYNYDRWYYDGTNLLQGIENNNLRATTYVINWEGSSTCSYSLNTAASSSQGGQSYTSIAKGATITISSVGSNNLWLKFNGDLTNLTKVSLVEGTGVSNFVSRLHPNELALCQRYYYRIFDSVPQYYTVANGVNFNTTGGATVPIPYQPMRATPSATLVAGSFSYSGNGGTGSTFTLVPYSGLFSVNYTGTSFQNWGVANINNSSATPLVVALSAEL